jgi:hypothetical protein
MAQDPNKDRQADPAAAGDELVVSGLGLYPRRLVEQWLLARLGSGDAGQVTGFDLGEILESFGD